MALKEKRCEYVVAVVGANIYHCNRESGAECSKCGRPMCETHGKLCCRERGTDQ